MARANTHTHTNAHAHERARTHTQEACHDHLFDNDADNRNFTSFHKEDNPIEGLEEISSKVRRTSLSVSLSVSIFLSLRLCLCLFLFLSLSLARSLSRVFSLYLSSRPGEARGEGGREGQGWGEHSAREDGSLYT